MLENREEMYTIAVSGTHPTSFLEDGGECNYTVELLMGLFASPLEYFDFSLVVYVLIYLCNILLKL